MIFLDTNIFLRYLTQDDAEKSAACLALLQRVRAGEEATTSEVVLAEVALRPCLASPVHAEPCRRERPTPSDPALARPEVAEQTPIAARPRSLQHLFRTWTSRTA